MRFACYGLTIDSEMDLPELPAGVDDAPADVSVQFGALGLTGEAFGARLGAHLWGSDASLWLRIPGIATFLIQDGARITVEAEAGIDQDSIRLFLLGSALGALLSQRGLMVLHGNAIQVGDACLVCVGPSGAGKSTLAAGFLQRGYSVLADDVVPITPEGLAIPGFPRIKLWQDAANKLKIETSTLRRVRPDFGKFQLALSASPSGESVPVRWIYALEGQVREGVKIEPLRGMAAFTLLQNNLYRARFLRGMSRQGEHLQLCGRLGAQARIARVTRPEQTFVLDALVDALLHDIATN